MLSAHVYCTSVKCAAAIASFTPLMGISREIDKNEREEGRFFFDPVTKFGKTDDLVNAFSIITRGGLNPMLAKPNREVCDMVNNSEHRLHACFRALTERDRLHALYRDAARHKATHETGVCLSTNHTPLAACLCALGHHETGHWFDGKSCHFAFEKTEKIERLASAYHAAWDELQFDFDHPLYWMKACLQKREEILKAYAKCEPYYVEKSGTEDSLRIVMTPLSVTPEQLEKAKRYL